MALAQKFDVVSESHRFLYEFLVLSRDMAHNACRQTYVLDSKKQQQQRKWQQLTLDKLQFLEFLGIIVLFKAEARVLSYREWGFRLFHL